MKHSLQSYRSMEISIMSDLKKKIQVRTNQYIITVIFSDD